MASTRRRTTAYAARSLLLLSLATSIMAQDLNAMTYKGCYSSSSPLTKKGEYTYQTSGYCQPICVKANQAVLGLTNGNECWCGDELPSSSSKVDDSKCSSPCDGYNKEDCGGNGYWTVYLSGTEDNVSSAGSSGGSGGGGSQTSAAPSLVTTISPGKTIVITQPASSDNSDSGSGGGTNGTAIAAGVVVAVVVISGVLAGLFFYLRHRRRQAAEEEYNRTQVSEFMRNGEKRPPPTSYSSTSASDSRLDPEFGNRRNSTGSIADNEDFSRKILRVANPDGGR